MLTKLRKHMKMVIIVVVIMFAGGMFAGFGYMGLKSFNQKETGIAKVSGKEIDLVRLNQNISRMASGLTGRRTPQEMAYIQVLALGQVIDFTLMLNDAKKNVRVSGGEIDGTINQIMETNKIPSKNDLERALKANGLDLKSFKKMLKEDILVQKMVAKLKSGVTVTSEDLREINAAHILISPSTFISTFETNAKKAEKKANEQAKALAVNLLERIKKGEDFSVLAKEYSADPGSKTKGGSLGFFTSGTMVPEFEKAAFALKPGEVSDIVKTQFGYHIVKLLNTKLRTLSKENAGKDIKEVVLNEKKEMVVNKWLFDLKQNNKVVILSPILRAYDFRLKGRFDMAINEYNIAISENPQDPYLHLLLGGTYEQIGNIDFAIAEYTKATSLNSSDPDLFLALGKAYNSSGKKQLALEQYKKASILSGDRKDLHGEIAEIYKNLGEKTLEKSERTKIAQIEAKEKFEEEIKNKNSGKTDNPFSE